MTRYCVAPSEEIKSSRRCLFLIADDLTAYGNRRQILHGATDHLKQIVKFPSGKTKAPSCQKFGGCVTEFTVYVLEVTMTPSPEDFNVSCDVSSECMDEDDSRPV